MPLYTNIDRWNQPLPYHPSICYLLSSHPSIYFAVLLDPPIPTIIILSTAVHARSLRPRHLCLAPRLRRFQSTAHPPPRIHPSIRAGGFAGAVASPTLPLPAVYPPHSNTAPGTGPPRGLRRRRPSSTSGHRRCLLHSACITVQSRRCHDTIRPQPRRCLLRSRHSMSPTWSGPQARCGQLILSPPPSSEGKWCLICVFPFSLVVSSWSTTKARYWVMGWSFYMSECLPISLFSGLLGTKGSLILMSKRCSMKCWLVNIIPQAYFTLQNGYAVCTLFFFNRFLAHFYFVSVL